MDNTEEKKNLNELETTIEPEMIVIDDDADMPTPQTTSYEANMIKCTPKFINLFNKVIGDLPYASVLKNSSGDQIKLIDLVKYIELKKDAISIEEMDKIVSFIANLSFKYSRPLMEIIEDQNKQNLLWEAVNN